MIVPFVVRRIDPCAGELARQACALQLAAHQVEAAWLNYPALPLMWADAAAVAASGYAIYGAFETEADGGEALRGLVALETREDGGLHVARTVVDPAHFGEGWGYRLLNHALDGASDVSVDTAAVNVAALSLYEKAGFVPEQRWLAPGKLALWRLRYRPLAGVLRFALGDDGWVAGARRAPSPNCDERPEGAQPELLVIHNISLPPYRYGGRGVEQLFSNQLNPEEHPFYAGIAGLRVSSHFFIRRDGELVQFVPVDKRAWHAGVSEWQGRERCNDFSVGVELEGCDFEPFTDAQYQVLAALADALKRQLPLRAVIGHEHIAPGRKTDPGPFFDWPRALADSGLAFGVQDSGAL